MYIKIHRGSMQIGGNIIEVGSGESRIILDCGKNLPNPNCGETVDNIEIDGLTSGKKKYEAVFVSHYHSDHCGNINRILPGIPVHMGKNTNKVLNIIADFTNSDIQEDITTFDIGSLITYGSITVCPIRVPHSAADSHMFLVGNRKRTILYTGDYKQVDEIIPKVKKAMNTHSYIFGNKIDVLLTEGTNIAPARSANPISTEDELSVELARIMEETTGDVFVLGSSTNIDRINAVAKACECVGRTFVQDLFTACIMDATHCESAFSKNKIKGFVWHGFNEKTNPRSFKYFKEHYDRRELCGIESIAKIKNLCAYIRLTMQRFLEDLSAYKSLEGSALVYSMWGGYKRKPQVAELIEFCEKAGMRIVPLHLSGHATNSEIAVFIKALEPHTVVPIHCECKDRELFRCTAPNCKFLNDNEVLEIGDGDLGIH